MYARTNKAITKKALEPITFVLAYPTVCRKSYSEYTCLCLSKTTHCGLLRLIVRSGLDIPTFATRRLHAYHHVRAPGGGR